jgi:hypothetical protein
MDAYTQGFMDKVAQRVRIHGKWHDSPSAAIAADARMKRQQAMARRRARPAPRPAPKAAPVTKPAPTAPKAAPVTKPAPAAPKAAPVVKPAPAKQPASKTIDWDAWRKNYKPSAALLARRKRVREFEASQEAQAKGI